MILAVAILSLLAVLSAIQVKTLIDRHQFEKEVSHLCLALHKAQILSTAYQTDIQCDIFFKEGVLNACFSTDEPFKAYEWNPQHIALPHVATLKFKGTKTSHLHFEVYSGRIEPRGILAFYPTDESDEAIWLDLQYGFLFQLSSQKPLLYKQQLPAKPKNIGAFL